MAEVSSHQTDQCQHRRGSTKELDVSRHVLEAAPRFAICPIASDRFRLAVDSVFVASYLLAEVFDRRDYAGYGLRRAGDQNAGSSLASGDL